MTATPDELLDVTGATGGTTPAFEAIDSHADLIEWSRAYCRAARREWVVDVRFDTVEWEVSTRARRRAAALKRPRIPDAEIGTPIDWDRARTGGGQRAGGRPFEATISLTWGAFEAFDRSEWASILRHELIHLEQFQRFGTTDHSSAFETRAGELDTEVHCRPFSDPKHVLRCAECGAVVARRYRDCKLVRRADEYQSSCCGAALTVE